MNRLDDNKRKCLSQISYSMKCPDHLSLLILKYTNLCNSCLCTVNTMCFGMHQWAHFGNVNICKSCVVKEKDVDRVLHSMVFENEIEIVKYLVDSGISVNTIHPDHRDYPLHKATTLAMGRFLIKHKADVNALNSESQNCLQTHDYATQTSELVKYLVGQGLDVNHEDDYERTPLFTWFHDPDVYKILINAGADVHHRDSSNETPLNLLASHPIGGSGRVQVLLDANADVNVKNDYGQTPLHGACVFIRNIELVKTLCGYNANVSVMDYENKTPLDITQEKKFGLMAAVLNSYMENEEKTEQTKPMRIPSI